jgi:hypothetical protein
MKEKIKIDENMDSRNQTLSSDYYVENNRVVFTEEYHIRRGHCCGSYNGCRHCPYYPKGIKGNTTLTEK